MNMKLIQNENVILETDCLTERDMQDGSEVIGYCKDGYVRIAVNKSEDITIEISLKAELQ